MALRPTTCKQSTQKKKGGWSPLDLVLEFPIEWNEAIHLVFVFFLPQTVFVVTASCRFSPISSSTHFVVTSFHYLYILLRFDSKCNSDADALSEKLPYSFPPARLPAQVGPTIAYAHLVDKCNLPDALAPACPLACLPACCLFACPLACLLACLLAC